ncbi:MAG: YdcF family protein [Acetobacter cibinongensis]
MLVFGAALRPDGTPSPSLRNRVSAAVSFGQNVAQPLYLVTGGVPKNGQTEASVMADLLLQAGVESKNILLEPTASDTAASIKACSVVLRQIGHDKSSPIHFCTSTYHIPRCALLLRLAGWVPEKIPYPFSIFPSRNIFRNVLIVGHEAIASLWDGLLVLIWRIVR